MTASEWRKWLDGLPSQEKEATDSPLWDCILDLEGVEALLWEAIYNLDLSGDGSFNWKERVKEALHDKG